MEAYRHTEASPSPLASRVRLGGHEQVLISVAPATGVTLQEQVQELQLRIDRVLHENGLNRDSVVKQTVFLRTSDDRDFCDKSFSKYYGKIGGPATSYMIQPPAGGEHLAIEITAVTGEDARVRRVNGNLTVVEEKGLRWAYVAGVEPDERINDTYEQALNVLGNMKSILRRRHLGLRLRNFGFRNIVRTWIYERDIVGKDGDGGQRYQKLNEARSRFFRNVKLDIRCGLVNAMVNLFRRFQDAGTIPPASTGIGASEGTFVMEALAISTKRKDVYIKPLQNPVQTNAFHYSQKQLLKGTSVGKKAPPFFSRGMSVVVSGDQMVLVSGTASIEGEKTVHIGDVGKQTEVTMGNIERVLGQAGASLKDVPQLRVYIKKKQDYAKVKRAVEEKCPGVPCLYMIADVCRDDLLVEIEAIAFLPL